MWDVSLTGTVSELEAQVGAAEAVDGDRQFDDLSPARTVIVVEDERVVGASVWLSRTQADAILEERSKIRCHFLRALDVSASGTLSLVQVSSPCPADL